MQLCRQMCLQMPFQLFLRTLPWDYISHQPPQPTPEAAPRPTPEVASPFPHGLGFPAAHTGSGLAAIPEAAFPFPTDSVFRHPPRHPWAKMAAGSGPGARELFAEGLLQFLRPAVRQLDRHVHSVRCWQGQRP